MTRFDNLDSFSFRFSYAQSCVGESHKIFIKYIDVCKCCVTNCGKFEVYWILLQGNGIPVLLTLLKIKSLNKWAQFWCICIEFICEETDVRAGREDLQCSESPMNRGADRSLSSYFKPSYLFIANFFKYLFVLFREAVWMFSCIQPNKVKHISKCLYS